MLAEHIGAASTGGPAGARPSPPVRHAFVFSLLRTVLPLIRPNSVTSRYSDLAEAPGHTDDLHKLRHYTATELIAAGVDVRTVAGRLGHGGGGTTTLRVYAAFVNEADQRKPQPSPNDCRARSYSGASPVIGPRSRD